MKKTLMLVVILSLTYLCSMAQDLKEIKLPAPVMSGGMPLMQALKERKTQRSFSPEMPEWQTVSNLLWAAYGINRPESGKRTVPSARNFQEMTLYVALKEGVYKWDAVTNVLTPVVSGDHRAEFGRQDFVETAPLIIAIVADYSKYNDMTAEQKEFYAGIDAGYISQNIYLFCASEKMATVVLGSVNKPEVGKLLKLGDKEKVTVCQPVGYPGAE
jgi:SagB-type dehydrogenase family enzyme